MKQVCYLMSISFLLLACNPSVEESNNQLPEPTLEEMVGQLIIAGFRGTTISTYSHILKDINRYGIGGVILYEYDVPLKSRPRNIESAEQILKLVNTLQETSKIPLFIAIDEEGGKVTRLKERYGFPIAPSAQYLGELNNPDSTKFWAGQTAKKLKNSGINLNFAPVVDLNVDPLSPAIGKLGRSFSIDPDTVAFHASITVEAHRQEGVFTSLKHFPGHGSAKTDSHLGFTDVSDTWTAVELEPYRQMINSGHCDLIMTAHVYNSHLDSLYPATLSKTVINDKLREELGWNGIIVSDDLQMGAIAQQYGLDKALELCLNAGVDLLIFSNNIPGEYNPEIVPEVHATIVRLVNDGAISPNRIKQSYQRIMAIKQKLK